ncbi:MAG: CRTAC1 family protein [Planctomycetes bacterium]|nr:CRTAC1 family protein [Planctomycetota bacterium]
MRVALALALLCPAAALADEGPRFVDVTLDRGLEAGDAHRNVFADLDGDGWPDLVIHKERVYRNVADPRGGRRFLRLDGGLVPSRPDLLALADLDDDGHQDALVAWRLDPTAPDWKDPGRRSHVRLLRHGTSGAAVVSSTVTFELPPEPLTCAAFLDFDLDGVLDLVTAGDYVAGGLPLEATPVRLYRGLGGGRFEEVTDRAGLTLRREPGHEDSRRPVYGLTTADIDGDGWPDILVCAYGRQRNLLYLNRGDGTFVEAGIASGFAGDDDTSGVYPEETKRWWKERFGQPREDERPFRANGNTFDAAVIDVDNDGRLDVFLAEITHAWAGSSSDRSALLANLGGARGALRFRRLPDAMPRRHLVPNWNQGDLYAGWTDADLDGWPDLLLASGDYPDEQRLRLFRQTGPLEFADVTAAAGIDVINAAQLSLADYDRDGDQDVITGLTNMRLPPEQAEARTLRPVLLENRTPRAGRRSLTLRLVGRGAAAGGANRDAIGARVVVEADGLRQTREVLGGHGHAGHQDSRELVFGLGRAPRVERVVVRWPSRTGTTVIEGLRPDRAYEVREPASGAAPEVVDLGPF